MKRTWLLILALLLTTCCMAQQEELTFPFQGGHKIMDRFFRDSTVFTSTQKNIKANGLVIFKFSADDQGMVSKIVIYYADDLALTEPVLNALKKSTRKWIIPNHEKIHDFILPINIGFNIPTTGNAAVQADNYNFYLHKKPFTSPDQIPMDEATLLPTVFLKYDL